MNDSSITDRFIIRPDQTDDGSVELLASDIAHWIVKQRDRIQQKIKQENELKASDTP